VKLLLAHPEIEVNVVDKNGWTTLMAATYSSDEEIVKLLLAREELDVNMVNMVNTKGWTAL